MKRANIRVNIVTTNPVYFTWFPPDATGLEKITVTASNEKEAYDLAKEQLLREGVDRKYIPNSFGKVPDKVRLFLQITSYIDEYGKKNKYYGPFSISPDAIVEVKVNL